jgi:hypothetical protein
VLEESVFRQSLEKESAMASDNKQLPQVTESSCERWVPAYCAQGRSRGDALGLVSMWLAVGVLVAPAVMWVASHALRQVACNPAVPPMHLESWAVIDAPFMVTLLLPVAGLVLGGAGLALRCARKELVLLGMLVHVAGVVAMIGALLGSSSPRTAANRM